VKKFFRPLGRKLCLILPLVFVSFLSFAGYSFAQEGTVSATVRPNPLEVKLTFPSAVPVGEWLEVEAEVSNKGDLLITKASASLGVSSGVSVRGKKRRLGDLAPGNIEVVKWMIKVRRPGNYIVQAEVKGNLLGEEILALDSSNTTAVGSLGAFLFRLIFGV